MSAIFRPLDANLNRIVRGQLFIRQPGAATEQNCGSVVVEFTPKRESTEIKTNEDPSRPIVARPTVDLQGEFKVTFSQWTRALTALALMAPSGEFFTQAAVVARTQTFTAVENGDVLVLRDADGKRIRNVTNVSVTADPGGDPLAATSYILDAATGTVQIDDASIMVDDLEVTFSAPAITVTDKKAQYRLLQARDLVVGFRVRQNNAFGANQDIVFPKVNVATSGSIKFIGDSNDPEKVEIDGLLLYDNTAPVGFERGYAVDI